MRDIFYIDRETQKKEKEEVYGKFFLELLYGNRWYEKLFSFFFLPLAAYVPFISQIYGYFQKTSSSKKKVLPFIQKYSIDSSEFLDPPESFASFNDFFIRRLKPSARSITSGNDVAVLPADARYLFYQDIGKEEGFFVKGKKFSLESFLRDKPLAEKYQRGSIVIARLCPVDYHRFHFPLHCVPSAPKLINGPLYSVNPLALRRNIEILAENKRVITQLQTKNFGEVIYAEIGATHVGSIHQTFTPGQHYAKGEEKGYFSFGGSCLVLLFEPGKIQFDQDLIDASLMHIETKALLGQSMGRALSLF